jgi:tellurite methyltransferase
VDAEGEGHGRSVATRIVRPVERAIVGFSVDEAGDWVASLSCGHRRHVRHQPPFREAPWVMDEAGRASRIGARIDCGRCDQAELPDGFVRLRTTPTWDERTVPAGLQRDHRLGTGVWGRLTVHDGALRFRAPSMGVDRDVGSGESVVLPPEVLHAVSVIGPVRFSIDLYVDETSQ